MVFFMSIENLTQNINFFKSWMRDKMRYDVRLAANDAVVKKVFFSIMNEINTNNDTDKLPISQLNSMTRSVAKDYFLLNYPHGKLESPQERSMFVPNGAFPTSVNDNQFLLPPETSRVISHDTMLSNNSTVDALASRYVDDQMLNITSTGNTAQEERRILPFKPELDVAPTQTETDTLLKQFNESRKSLEENVVLSASSQVPALNDNDYISEEVTKTSAVLIPPEKIKDITRYICINGFDRDVRLYPYRTSFKAHLTNPLKNVRKFKVGFVHIPCEHADSASKHKIYNIPLENMYPYLLLVIDELVPQYEGSNNAITRAICTLTFVRNNYPVNARGYVSLVPGQNEICSFDNAPLSVLSSLTLSLLTPTGELFPSTRDDHRITRVTLVPSTTHPAFGGALMISLDKFVDVNEYTVTDKVRIYDFRLLDLPNSLTPEQTNIIESFVDFLTRAEGHDIIALDTVALTRRMQTFTIKLPGSLSPTDGLWHPESRIVNLLENKIIMTKALNDYDIDTSCRVMNMSLQMSVGISVNLASADYKDSVWMSQTIQG